MTEVEKALARIWARFEHSGLWWDCFNHLLEIRDVLLDAGAYDASELFHLAAYHALDRCVYDMRQGVCMVEQQAERGFGAHVVPIRPEVAA